MLTIEEVQVILEDVVKRIKSHRPTKDKPLVEFYDGYNKLVHEYRHICWHTDRGVFPHELFAERSPNQQPDEFEYIKRNYKQVTLPLTLDFFNTIKRTFSDGNWDIKIDNEELSEYIYNDFPIYKNFEEFIKNILPVIKEKDPNGCLAVRPIDFDYVDEERARIDDTKPIRPTIIYFNIEQKLIEHSDFYLFLSDERSSVEYGNNTVKDGLIFELYDDTNIYLIKQKGKKTDYIFDIELFYEHNLGYIPVNVLKAIPVIREKKIHYLSRLSFAVDNMDLILLNSANLQAAINNCVYPTRVMVGNECDFIDNDNNPCISGKIRRVSGDTISEVICPSCNGSGLKSRLSVLGTVLIRPKSRENPDGEVSAGEAFKFVSPDTSSLDFLMKNIDANWNRAIQILHLKKESENTGENIIESINKNKSLTAFIKPISDEIFENIEFCLNTIIDMRYGVDEPKPVYIYPLSFEFMTDADYLNMIKAAQEANLPPMVKLPLIRKYISSLYITDEYIIKVFNLIINVDRLFTMTKEEIQFGITAGTVSKLDSVIHDSILYFINELYNENDKFFDLDFDEQKRMIEELASQNVEEGKSVVEEARDELINTQPEI